MRDQSNCCLLYCFHTEIASFPGNDSSFPGNDSELICLAMRRWIENRTTGWAIRDYMWNIRGCFHSLDPGVSSYNIDWVEHSRCAQYSSTNGLAHPIPKHSVVTKDRKSAPLTL